MTTLFVTSSLHGSTREIAERMGEVLRTSQAVETVVEDVAGAATWLDTADAVVLAAPVYGGKLAKDARQFLNTRRAELNNKPLVIIVSGGNPVLAEGIRAQLETYQPRTIEYVRGALTEARLSWLEKFLVKRAGGQFGDFRDWDHIESVAKSLPGHGIA
ncbi:MAG: flavodoxin domain-containing protein [Micrococcus sp.]|nr:flavodoxin domain-containing protein [Micrococcus sp.]